MVREERIRRRGESVAGSDRAGGRDCQVGTGIANREPNSGWLEILDSDWAREIGLGVIDRAPVVRES